LIITQFKRVHEKMSVLGPHKKNAIAYSTMMASGKSEWLTREDVMDSMNTYITYDKVDLTPCSTQEKQGTLWYGFRLRAFKKGKPERTMIIDGEEETIKAREDLFADTVYYFENKQTHDFIWEYWTNNECVV